MTLRGPLTDFQQNMDHGSTLDPILEQKKFPLTQVENSSFCYLIYSRELVLDKKVDQNFLIFGSHIKTQGYRGLDTSRGPHVDP